MPARLRVLGAGTRLLRVGARIAVLAAPLALALAAGAAAQTPAAPSAAKPLGAPQPKPVTGFVPGYEIMRTVRSAGFDPLAPPLREGTTYVLRATDYRGILMRVVLDARTGTIRDVTRIVPSASGSLGVIPPPYGPPPPYGRPPYVSPRYAAPAYDAPDEIAEPTLQLPPPAETPASPLLPRPAAAPAVKHANAPSGKKLPPLPRPRPASLSAPQPASAEKPAAAEKPAVNADAAHAQAAPSPPAAQAKSPAAVPLND